MELEISALKLKTYLGNAFTDEIADKYENARDIYSVEFPGIKHLSQVKEGIYDVEILDTPNCNMSCFYYSFFREEVCKMAHNTIPLLIWDEIENWLGKPFIEMINFADNEGSYDYVIAEKLLKDFSDYKEQAKDFLIAENYFKVYCDYMEVLRAAVENKGVVCYSRLFTI